MGSHKSLPRRSCLHSEAGSRLLKAGSDVCPAAISTVLINGLICVLPCNNTQAGPKRICKQAPGSKEACGQPLCLPSGRRSAARPAAPTPCPTLVATAAPVTSGEGAEEGAFGVGGKDNLGQR